MERFDLKGTTKAKAHHAFIKQFWLEFGADGNKTYRSPKSKQQTLDRLKDMGDMIVFRNNDTPKNKIARKKFDWVKAARHSLKSHRMCFACGAKADVRHHIIWLKHGGLNSKRNLISLCNPCHAYIHPWLQLGRRSA